MVYWASVQQLPKQHVMRRGNARLVKTAGSAGGRLSQRCIPCMGFGTTRQTRQLVSHKQYGKRCVRVQHQLHLIKVPVPVALRQLVRGRKQISKQRKPLWELAE